MKKLNKGYVTAVVVGLLILAYGIYVIYVNHNLKKSLNDTTEQVNKTVKMLNTERKTVDSFERLNFMDSIEIASLLKEGLSVSVKRESNKKTLSKALLYKTDSVFKSSH